MQPFAPLSEYQFQQLAMGKARGFTWNMMADQLSLPLHVVERVPWTHEKLWNRTLTKAERLIARETIAETASTLRRDLRNAEPNLHATLTNSLTRLLQLQQDFAPPRRHVPKVAPTVPVVTTPTPPAPVAPTTPTTPATTAPTVEKKAASSSATIGALMGLLLLVGALLLGCWRGSQQAPKRSEYVADQPVAVCVLVSDEPETLVTPTLLWVDDGRTVDERCPRHEHT